MERSGRDSGERAYPLLDGFHQSRSCFATFHEIYVAGHDANGAAVLCSALPSNAASNLSRKAS